jgi:hypothetical protein
LIDVYQPGVRELARKIWPHDKHRALDYEHILWATDLVCRGKNWIIVSLRNGLFGPPRDVYEVSNTLGLSPEYVQEVEHRLYRTLKIFLDGDPKPGDRPEPIHFIEEDRHRLMRNKDLLEWLQIGESIKDHFLDLGMPHIRLPNRRRWIRYRKADVERWLARYKKPHPKPRRKGMSVTFTVPDPHYTTVPCTFCAEIKERGGEPPCIQSCDGTMQEQAEPSVNLANANARDVLDMIGEGCDSDIYGSWPLDKLPVIRRKLIRAINVPSDRTPYLRDPCVETGARGARSVDAGNSDESILRRLRDLLSLVEWAQDRGFDINYG